MKLFWKFYCALYFAIVLNNAFLLLNKDSLLGVYYNTTIVFNPWYSLPYYLNILNALINCIVSLFIFGYAFNRQDLNRPPQWLFYVRLLSDCTGHTYELIMIQAGFYQSKLMGYIGLAALIVPILPSYLAHWRMTFNRKS